MQSSRPIDDNVGSVVVQSGRSPDGSGGVEHAEFVEAVKNGAILAHVKSLELSGVVSHVVGRNDLEEVDVVVGMEASHGGGRDETGTEYVHSFVEAVVDYEVVGHAVLQIVVEFRFRCVYCCQEEMREIC